jgi:rubredoxin
MNLPKYKSTKECPKCEDSRFSNEHGENVALGRFPIKFYGTLHDICTEQYPHLHVICKLCGYDFVEAPADEATFSDEQES